MTEQRFIRKNKSKWEEFEAALTSRETPQPDRLSDLYLHLIDDLSYARTHYPNSRLVHYLNQLAVRAHRMIYRTRKERRNRLITLFTEEIPKTFGQYRRYLGYAAVAFIVAIALGAASTIIEPDFTRMVLGDTYVNLTLENIEQEDPMAIYRSMRSDAMFSRIAVNNVRVAFMMYILGIFFGVPTILLLLTNGVMVGTFLQFFVQEGLGWTAFSTIFLHGAMELSAIVVAGACGLLLGSSTVFPGTYPRSHTLMQGAKDSLKLMIGVTPFVVAAALVEGYVTRLYLDMPGSVRLLVIFGSLIPMAWYILIYPLKFKTHG